MKQPITRLVEIKMKETDELKQKAAPKFAELTEAMKESNREQVITNNLLCQLCDQKEAQRQGDIKFRNSWKKSKINDTRMSLVLLILANIALYLDIIRVDGTGAFITGVMNLFN